MKMKRTVKDRTSNLWYLLYFYNGIVSYLDYFQKGKFHILIIFKIHYIRGCDAINFVNRKQKEQILDCHCIANLHELWFSWRLCHLFIINFKSIMIFIFSKFSMNFLNNKKNTTMLKIIKNKEFYTAEWQLSNLSSYQVIPVKEKGNRIAHHHFKHESPKLPKPCSSIPTNLRFVTLFSTNDSEHWIWIFHCSRNP